MTLANADFGKTVLVVDDHAAIRKMLASTFLSDGFKKYGEAADGKEAIALAKRIKPDVVALDFSMPGMSGLEVASELRQIFPKIPIILLTLYSNEILRIEDRANFHGHRQSTRKLMDGSAG